MTARLVDGLFGTVVLAIGVLNLLLVHPVPGVVFVLASLVFFRPAQAVLERTSGRPVPRVAKVVLGLAIVWFTLGVSDLGDMLD